MVKRFACHCYSSCKGARGESSYQRRTINKHVQADQAKFDELVKLGQPVPFGLQEAVDVWAPVCFDDQFLVEQQQSGSVSDPSSPDGSTSTLSSSVGGQHRPGLVGSKRLVDDVEQDHSRVPLKRRQSAQGSVGSRGLVRLPSSTARSRSLSQARSGRPSTTAYTRAFPTPLAAPVARRGFSAPTNESLSGYSRIAAYPHPSPSQMDGSTDSLLSAGSPNLSSSPSYDDTAPLLFTPFLTTPPTTVASSYEPTTDLSTVQSGLLPFEPTFALEQQQQQQFVGPSMTAAYSPVKPEPLNLAFTLTPPTSHPSIAPPLTSQPSTSSPASSTPSAYSTSSSSSSSEVQQTTALLASLPHSALLANPLYRQLFESYERLYDQLCASAAPVDVGEVYACALGGRDGWVGGADEWDEGGGEQEEGVESHVVWSS